MTIYDELRNDHQEVKDLISQLESAEKAEQRRELITQIRDALVPHSRAEEAVFYNTLRDIDQAKDLVRHGYQEHLMAETLLRGLQVTESVALNWQSGVRKFREELFHHIAEEEGRIFAAAKSLFTDEEAQMMGEAFQKLKPTIGANVVSSNMELIANLLPERFRKNFMSRIQETGETRQAS